jgi:hypothetical protein
MAKRILLIAAFLSLVAVLPALAVETKRQDDLLFRDANGVPMGIKRQGNGFLIAYAGQFYTVKESSSLAFIGEDQKYRVADWSHGHLELSTNESAIEAQPAESFRFVDWDGKVWEAAAKNGEFIIRPLPDLTPVGHVQCIKARSWCDAMPHLSCWAPSGKIRSISPDDLVVRFAPEFSYLGWDNKPRTATWRRDQFMVRLDGGPQAITDSLQFLDWNGMKRNASWDAVANQFVISGPRN